MITGKCVCGAVTWSVEGDPLMQMYCHCDSCQKANSAVFVGAALVPADKVSITGDLISCSVTDGEHAAVRHSCAKCGSRVMNAPGGKGGSSMRAIFPVLCDDRSWFKPGMHIFYEDRVVDIDDALPKFLDVPEGLGGSGQTA